MKVIIASSIALAASASAMTINPLMARDNEICVKPEQVEQMVHIGKANARETCEKFTARCGSFPDHKKSCHGTPDKKVIAVSCQADQKAYTNWILTELNKAMPTDQRLGLVVPADGSCERLPGVAGEKCAMYNFDYERHPICTAPKGEKCVKADTVGDRFYVGDNNTRDVCDKFLASCNDWFYHNKKSCMGSPDAKVITASCEATEDRVDFDTTRFTIGKISMSLSANKGDNARIGLLVNGDGKCNTLPGVAGSKCAQYDFDTKPRAVCAEAGKTCVDPVLGTQQFYAAVGAGDSKVQCDKYKKACNALKKFGKVLASNCDQDTTSDKMLLNVACDVQQNNKEYFYGPNVAKQLGFKLAVSNTPNCGEKMDALRCAKSDFSVTIPAFCPMV